MYMRHRISILFDSLVSLMTTHMTAGLGDDDAAISTQVSRWPEC